MNKIICFILVSSFSFLVSVSSIHAATFSLSSSSPAFNQGCNYSLDVTLNAQNQSTNAADIIIDYDPDLVTIIDQDTALTGVQIKPGTVFSNYFGNQVDTTNGVIRLTGATFTGTFSSIGTFATIRFSPLVSDAPITFAVRFTGANPHNTLDSNIADSDTSNDLLSSVQNILINPTSGSCATDTTPPTITFIAPVNGQISVPATANISFRLSDSDSGVDINSLKAVVNGVTYTSSDSQITSTGNSTLYNFILDPTDPLFTSQTNTLLITAADFSGNSRTSLINFNTPPLPTYTPAPTPASTCTTTTIVTSTPAPTSTPSPLAPSQDNTSPLIQFIKPQSKDTVDFQPNIILKLSDSGSGINLNTLKIEIDYQTILHSQPNLSVTGNKSQYLVTTKLPLPLKPSSQYVLSVFVADLKGNGLSQSIIVKTPALPSIPLLGFIQQWLPVNDIKPYQPPSTTTPKTTPIPSSVSPKTSSLSTPSIYFYIFIIIGICLSAALISLILWSHNLLKSKTQEKPLGIVYDYQTNYPIASILINIFDAADNFIVQSETNHHGIFSAALAPGQYRFKLSDTTLIPPTSVDTTPGRPVAYKSQLITLTSSAKSNPFIFMPIKLK